MMKHKQQRRWRVTCLTLAATGALLCSSAAWAVNLTCGAGNKAEATFTTNKTDWEITGPRYSFTGWHAIDMVASNDGVQGKGNWASAPWLTPGDTKANSGSGYASGKAYFFRLKVTLDSRIDPATVKVDTTRTGAFVDDCLNRVTITQSAAVPADSERAKATGSSCGKTGVGMGRTEANIFDSGFRLDAGLFSGTWAAGDNYMIWKVSNAQERHKYPFSGTASGPTGLYAKVTLTADCKALPPSPPSPPFTGPAPVPVNNPWALGLLGAAVAGAAARARRRRK